MVRREDWRRFWALIATGLSSEDAATGAGVLQPVGSRWFRKAGGMPASTLAPSSKPLSARYLSLAEREELAILRARGAGVREIGRRLGRSGSTISRELRRNAATRGGGLEYRAITAQWHAERPGRRPKLAKLAVNAALRVYVQDGWLGRLLAQVGRRSPGQDFWASDILEGPPTWTAEITPIGGGVEPGTDCPPPAARLPGRWNHAGQPRGHLPGAVCAKPGRAPLRIDYLPSHGPGAANPTCAQSRLGKIRCRSRSADQRTPS